MIAEIRGKVNSINSNLTERLEDELTGNFFGNLRYLPFEMGLKRILKKCIFPAELRNVFNGLSAEAWPSPASISFWPREDKVEPDVVLFCDNAVIIVEVKYRSGISSDDDVDNSGNADEREASCHQLDREGRLLEHIADGKDKVLILLAKEDSAHEIYSNVVKRKLLSGVRFGYITWQKAFDALHTIPTTSPYEEVVVDDLIDLLRKKGFEGFRNFEINTPVDETDIWEFEYTGAKGFSFEIKQKIERDVFYEFGG